MRKTIKKTLALLLTALMLFGTAIPMVSATGTTETTYPSYEEAEPGALLYKVDFKETRYDYKLLSGNATLTPSDDGRSLTMATTAGGCSFGGAVADMPMGEGAGVYTISFTLTVAGPYEHHHIYANSTTTDGFVVRSDVVGVSDGFENTYDRNLHKNCFPYKPLDAANIEYKMVVDNSVGQIDLYMNAQTTSGSQYGWILVETGDYTTADENLNIVFGSRKNKLDARSVTVSDLLIYKGVSDTIAVNRPGELLLELGDMSEAQTNTQNGVEYDPNINYHSAGGSYELNYSYGDGGIHVLGGTRKAWEICQYGGTTNLRLGYGQKYTVTYSVKQNNAYVCGLAFSAYPETTRTYSVAMDADSISIRKNTGIISDPNTVADTKYTESAKTDGTVYCNDGYANVAVELDNYQITVYVNGAEQISWSTLPPAGDQKSHIGYTVQNLTLAFAESMNTATTNVESDNFAQYKDVKVYSGLTVSNKYVTVIDGETTETVAIPATENYTLPTRTAPAGYVFNGWKINGEGKPVAAGESVSTDGLTSITAVYTKAMSDVWVQFGNTNTEKNTTDMRIVGVLDSLNYQSIGYDVVIKYTVNGEPQEYVSEAYELHNVYNSLLAKYGTEVVTPETLGFGADSGYYLTAFTIFNVPTNIGEITFELTPYQIDLDGNKVPGDKVSVSFEEMWAQNNASEN